MKTSLLFLKLFTNLCFKCGWRTFQPRTFQPQASTPDLSTLDFWTMNLSTPNQKGTFQPQTFQPWTFQPQTSHPRTFQPQVWGWKVPFWFGVERFMVEKSGVEAWGWKVRGWNVLQPGLQIPISLISTNFIHPKESFMWWYISNGAKKDCWPRALTTIVIMKKIIRSTLWWKKCINFTISAQFNWQKSGFFKVF